MEGVEGVERMEVGDIQAREGVAEVVVGMRECGLCPFLRLPVHGRWKLSAVQEGMLGTDQPP